MMSGDSGGSTDWPQISLREGASTYRCKYFYQSFNNPERCVRPVIPIANFMTHGILLSHRKPFTDFNDSLHDWANYVLMYCGRGTTLKELYLDLDLVDDDHWMVPPASNGLVETTLSPAASAASPKPSSLAAVSSSVRVR